MQLAAATAAAWALWPRWAAVAVTVLCLSVIITERPRWRWLLSAPVDPARAQPVNS